MTLYYVDGAVGNDGNAGTSPGAGNAWATIGKAASTITNGDLAWIKASAVYSLSSAITFNATDSYTGRAQFIGYGSTPGDGIPATVRATAGSFFMFDINQNGVLLQNLIIDGNNQTSITGVRFSSQYSGIVGCLIKNCTNNGVLVSATYSHLFNCEVTGCSAASAVAVNSTPCVISGCKIHDNTVTGIDGSSGISNIDVISSEIYKNTGSSSDGITVGYGCLIQSNTIHGNGRDGIRLLNNYIGIQPGIRNNLLTVNGASGTGYGINFASAPLGSGATTPVPEVDYNAFYNNATADRNNYTIGSHDVTLTADPYINSAANNYSLNNTPGGGAACRGAAFSL